MLTELTVGLYDSKLSDQHSVLSGRAELEREAAEWVHWHNTSRLHSSIDYLPPVRAIQSERWRFVVVVWRVRVDVDCRGLTAGVGGGEEVVVFGGFVVSAGEGGGVGEFEPEPCGEFLALGA